MTVLYRRQDELGPLGRLGVAIAKGELGLPVCLDA